jgi:hypothetical protein
MLTNQLVSQTNNMALSLLRISGSNSTYGRMVYVSDVRSFDHFVILFSSFSRVAVAAIAIAIAIAIAAALCEGSLARVANSPPWQSE